MSAVLTMGLVIDMITKMSSVDMRLPPSMYLCPCALRCTTSPLLATSVTTPATWSVSMYRCMAASNRSSRSDDMPTLSASAMGRFCASAVDGKMSTTWATTVRIATIVV